MGCFDGAGVIAGSSNGTVGDGGAAGQRALRIEYGARESSDPSTGFYKIEARFFSCTMLACRLPFSAPRNPPSPPEPLLGSLTIRGKVVVSLVPVVGMSAYSSVEREGDTLPIETGSLRTTPLTLTSSQSSDRFDIPIPLPVEFLTTTADLALIRRNAPPLIAWRPVAAETEIEFSIETDRHRVRCGFPGSRSPQTPPSSILRELAGEYTVSLGSRTTTSVVPLNLGVQTVRIGNAGAVPLRAVKGTIN